MSIAAALNSAASGLAATARSTEVVAGNVANALTPGYGRRQVQLASLPDGGGVRIASVERLVQASLVGDARIARAAQGASQTVSQFRKAVETALGVPGEGGALADRVADFDAALISAASRPDNQIRLGVVSQTGRALVGAVNEAADAIQAARTEADQAIKAELDRLRTSLGSVARLNRSIIVERANGRDASALMDERQRALDDISSIVPIREVTRDNGRVAVFTVGGAILLDGNEPLDLSFALAGVLTAAMQVGTPPVARLVVEGEEVGSRLMSLFGGGSLEAHFRVRDELAPEAQARLDAFALDLMQRFADPTVDPTLTAGLAGVFTDGTSTTSAATEKGLANRLALNKAFATDGMGDWRWRDGLGAASAGDVGRSTLLASLASALSGTRSTASTAIQPGSRSAAGFASELSSLASTARVVSDGNVARTTAHVSALDQQIMADGVDSDAEMQRLLQLEQAYAANARVIQAADAMISRILEL